MAEAKPWQRLAAELLEHGVESRYLARISARVEPAHRLATLEVEIAKEMASALGRTEERLNLALAELELHHARYQRAVRGHASADERSSLAAAFNAQRARAEARRRDLLIQREALGFRRNQILQELYPIPPKLAP